MGALVSEQVKFLGNFDIKLDSPYFISGKYVTGDVHLHLDEPIPADCITIQLCSYESAKWNRNNPMSSGEYDELVNETIDEYCKVNNYYGDSSLIECIYYSDEMKLTLLHKFSNGIAQKGDYIFPFKIKIPSCCPASANYNGLNEAFGYIHYNVFAELKPVKNICYDKYTSKLEQIFIIQEPLSITFDKIIRAKTNVTGFLGIIDKGCVKLQMKVPKSAYMIKNETCKIACLIDNSQCRSPVESILVRMLKHVKLTDGSSSIVRSCIVHEHKYEGIGAECKTDGFSREFIIPLCYEDEIIDKDSVVDQENSNGKEDRSDDIDNYCESDSSLSLNSKEVENDEIDFNNCKVHPTSIGKCISIIYSIEVILNFSNFLANSISVQSPLFIYAPPCNEIKKDYKYHNTETVICSFNSYLSSDDNLDDFNIKDTLLKS